MTDEFPSPPPGRPLWLVTLADLALLLLGFLLLIQVTERSGRPTLVEGLRSRFGGSTDAKTEPQRSPALPVAAAGISFAPGSAALPISPAGLVAWAREAVRDPRVTVTVTGSTDGSAADRDSLTGSAAILAADRARTTAAALATTVPADRLLIATAPRPGHRAALVTLAFAGEAH